MDWDLELESCREIFAWPHSMSHSCFLLPIQFLLPAGGLRLLLTVLDKTWPPGAEYGFSVLSWSGVLLGFLLSLKQPFKTEIILSAFHMRKLRLREIVVLQVIVTCWRFKDEKASAIVEFAAQ